MLFRSYDTCSRCDYTTYVEIPALGHDWGDPEWSWAEDYSTATATFTCKRDTTHVETVNANIESEPGTGEHVGYTVYTAAAQLDGHTYIDTQYKKNTYIITWIIDGTPVEEGYEYGATPSYSGGTPTKEADETYTYEFANWTPTIAEVTGNATYTAVFHQYGAPEWAWGDNNTATATFNCTHCGFSYQYQVEVTSSVITAPTCTESGLTKHTAVVTFNGREYTDTHTEIVAALGHDLIHHDAKAATCTEIGWDAYDTCSRCD